jgi:uncharacterized UBP type Zn finger protein
MKEAIEKMFTAITSWTSNSNCNLSNKGNCCFLATTILSFLRSGKFCTKDESFQTHETPEISRVG